MKMIPFATVIFLSFCVIAHAAPVIPNAASIIGIVSEYGIVSSHLLDIEPEQTVYKLNVYLESSEDIAGMTNFVEKKQGHAMTFYTKEQLSSDIFGKRVKAEVSYIGDERGGRWWVRNIRILAAY